MSERGRAKALGPKKRAGGGLASGEGRGDRCIAPPIIFRKGKNERCVKTGKKSGGARVRTCEKEREGGKAESDEKGEGLWL